MPTSPKGCGGIFRIRRGCSPTWRKKRTGTGGELIDTYMERFGKHIPLIRREDIRGLVSRRPIWQVRSLGVEAVRRHAQKMENDAARFYSQAAGRATDAEVRRLLGDLAAAEAAHETTAGEIEARRLPGDVRGARGTTTRAAGSCCRSCSRGWSG